MPSTFAQVSFTPSSKLYPFESRWFESSAGRVHYIDEGSGRPILFLHGNPTWSFLYRKIITRLRDRYRCVAVDYPGFGLSVRPEGYGYTAEEHARVVSELVSHLGLDDLVIMGQDWGGPIGLAVALDRADRVGGLVFGNTWFWPVDQVRLRTFGVVMGSLPLQWLLVQQNLFVDRVIPAGTTVRLTSEEMDHYRRAQPAPEARAGVAAFPKQLHDARPLLERLAGEVPRVLGDKPLLLVWGMRDIVFKPEDYLPRWQSAFSDWKLVELPWARHYIQEDAPEQISDAISQRFA